MNIDKLEAFTEFAQHLETEHDIPFTALRCKTLCVGNDRDLIALCCNDQCDYPHAICEYDDEHGIFYYRLVGDNKYHYRVKKNDDASNNKDVLESLKDKCRDIFTEIGYQMELIPLSERRSASVILDNVVKLINIIDDATTEEKE